ncbi:MAG: hypothetical protein KBD03_01850 [Gammaproteobacteria bacterium]|nr:hypothetical protein [Gammaproteobacteria bacterium]
MSENLHELSIALKRPEEQLNPSSVQEKPFLSLKTQKKIIFQRHIQQECQAIEHVKAIIEARLEYKSFYLDWLMKEKPYTMTPENFYNIFINKAAFDKQILPKGVTKLFFLTQFMETAKENFRDEIRVYKYMIEKIQNKTPYLLEGLFRDATSCDAVRSTAAFYSRVSKQWNHEAMELKYFRKMVEILSPYLTSESKFYLQKTSRLDRTTSGYEIDIKLGEKMCHEIKTNIDSILKSSIKHSKQESQQQYAEELNSRTKKILKEIKSLSAEALLLQEEVKEKATAASQENVRFDLQKDMALYSRLRNNFDKIYYVHLQVNELENLLKKPSLAKTNHKQKTTVLHDSASASSSCPVSESGSSSSSTSNSAQEVPTFAEIPQINDIVVQTAEQSSEQKLQEKEVVQQFIRQKQEQLRLWKQMVIERRDQRLREQQIVSENIGKIDSKEKTEMTPQHAKQLLALVQNLNSDQELFDSFFKSDDACKPINVHYRDIKRFVGKLQGTIEQEGTSHFRLHFPNTYRIWQQQEEAPNILAYVDIPETIGGGFRPHGSEEWTRSAHFLFARTLEKSGITPKRIEEAQRLLVLSSSSMYTPLLDVTLAANQSEVQASTENPEEDSANCVTLKSQFNI